MVDINLTRDVPDAGRSAKFVAAIGPPTLPSSSRIAELSRFMTLSVHPDYKTVRWHIAVCHITFRVGGLPDGAYQLVERTQSTPVALLQDAPHLTKAERKAQPANSNSGGCGKRSWAPVRRVRPTFVQFYTSLYSHAAVIIAWHFNP